MNRLGTGVVIGFLAGTALLFFRGGTRGAAAAPAPADSAAEINQLREQVKHLESIVPDQSAVMTKVAYHFTNLWIAVQHDNWPLADYYLGEVRNNVKWAVRAKPIRTVRAGTLDLNGIAEAIDNTQFADLKKAIDAKQKEQFVQLYEQTLTACYACHQASEKPYLRPQKPAEPEVKIVNFDPTAAWPK
ncbi:MAG TPA: hypothetical protein VK797_17265 [Tepidisphaeraceae bacterium]|jgi:hypothetical protein|nr:hypothetical protein [Tepidisphaeraceae bacterium]